MSRTKKNMPAAKGFTIVELLIASSVFALVLLVVLTGFLQIGHIFYKGIANTSTQNAVKQIVSDVAGSLQNTTSDDFFQSGTSGSYTYYCIGNARYTFATYNNSDASLTGLHTYYDSNITPENMDPYDNQPSMGLIKNYIPMEGACPTPCLTGVSDQAACTGSNFWALNNNPQEMLGDHMRVTDFTIAQKPSGGNSDKNLYDINVVVAYGKNEMIGYNSGAPYCLGNSSDQQFCAIEQLQTTTQRGSRLL